MQLCVWIDASQESSVYLSVCFSTRVAVGLTSGESTHLRTLPVSKKKEVVSNVSRLK